ncbi:MAG: hypothetical protein JW781_10840 [Deltaproteobacteria bacterium]|nr:hypothetical protein [Candidatus Anaeroferrophillacea bacterium]
MRKTFTTMAIALLIVTMLSGFSSCSKDEELKERVRQGEQTEPVAKSGEAGQEAAGMPPGHPPVPGTAKDGKGAECPATGAEHQGSLASGMGGHGGEQRSHAVIVPAAVEETWKRVIIEVLDKKGENTSRQTVDITGGVALADSGIELRILHFLPDFVMNSFGMTSKSNEPENPAVKFSLAEKGEEIYTGWLFANFPDVHTLQHERFAFKLVDWQKK